MYISEYVCKGNHRLCGKVIKCPPNELEDGGFNACLCSISEHGGYIYINELGEYSVTAHPQFEYETGEKLQFYCPLCHKEIASDLHENLAKILLVDESGSEFHIHFSKVAGEKSTFKIIGDNVEVFGEHSDHYLDLLGMR